MNFNVVKFPNSIDGTTKTKSYVFKTMLPNEKGGADIDALGLFPKELAMYKTYLPAIEALYKAAGEDIQIAPKCLHTEQREGSIHFIFEDLSTRKFQNVDRLNGLDMAHMTRALRKLAEFHAGSTVYEEQNGPFPSEFFEGFVSLKTEEFAKDSFKLRGEPFRKSMETWGMKDVEKYIKNFVSTKIIYIKIRNNLLEIYSLLMMIIGTCPLALWTLILWILIH